MALRHVDAAISGFDIQWRVPILAELSQHASVLRAGATQVQIAAIALAVSQVSGGGGLDLVSLLLWPDDGSDPDFLPDAIDRVQANMRDYSPGEKYGI